MSDSFVSTRIGHNKWSEWGIKMPETLEEALHVVQALAACGITLNADDRAVQEQLDKNPMLERR